MAIMTNECLEPTKNTRKPDHKHRAKFVYLPFLLAAIFFSAHACKADAQTHGFTAGIYETLMLAVNSRGELSGYYRESQGQGVVRTCAFYLQGKANAGQANIITWSRLAPNRSGILTGHIAAEGKDDLTLKIEDGQDHPGCGNILLPEIADEGVSYSRTYEAKWLGLKAVTADKAFLYAKPTPEHKRKAYVIKNDVLGVLSEENGWVYIEYPRPGKKSVKGWVKSSDVQDPRPPK